jgi:uncharacterized membrane-anchored protein
MTVARTFSAALAVAAMIVSAAAYCQADPNQAVKAAFEAAKRTKQEGPVDVKLADQATLHVPQGFVFVPRAEAIGVLRAMGNSPSPDTLGMVFPEDGSNWFAVSRYVKSGHIMDDDAKDWNADELLSNIKQGTEHANADRRGRGIPELEVIGWVERPAYDAGTHRLVWSASSKDKGTDASGELGVNYNTYLLGREGYVSVNFVTDLASIEQQKPLAKQILAAVEFDRGKTYADFNASTDHLAEYGLAALIGGVAAKKLGLFALIAAFVAKFAKVIGIAVLGGGAGIAKYFRRKQEASSS